MTSRSPYSRRMSACGAALQAARPKNQLVRCYQLQLRHHRKTCRHYSMIGDLQVTRTDTCSACEHSGTCSECEHSDTRSAYKRAIVKHYAYLNPVLFVFPSIVKIAFSCVTGNTSTFGLMSCLWQRSITS